jgi:hypothetical protein
MTVDPLASIPCGNPADRVRDVNTGAEGVDTSTVAHDPSVPAT